MAVERTFVIADLAGFTAAVEVHGDEAAADMAIGLVGAAVDSLGTGDELVKAMGDAVLVAAADPSAGLGFVRRLYDRFAADDADLLMLRAGLHHGSAVRRGSDYFGTGVNVAARVADLSAGCQLLATSRVAAAARRSGMPTVAMGEFELRNVAEPVEVFEIDCGHDARGHTIDPVCRMRVRRGAAAAALRHAGRDHWFCSLDCVVRFATDPGRYTTAEVEP
jgi:class 3 adenylate cyclase/YHS domain-containing protein